MEATKVAGFWVEQARTDFETARTLERGKRYAPALFFVHLALEKFFKARVVIATRAPAPYTHDLVTLAERCALMLSENQKDFLREVNTFNVRARYDDYKQNFYKRATRLYTRRALQRAHKFIIWLDEQR